MATLEDALRTVEIHQPKTGAFLRREVARLEGELADERSKLRDYAEAADVLIGKEQVKVAALAAALKDEIENCPRCAGKGTVWINPPQGEKDIPCVRCRGARAALSDEGKGWLEVREQARATIEELFSLADRIPVEVRQRVEAVLDALGGK